MSNQSEYHGLRLEDPDVGGYNIYRGLDNSNMNKIATVREYKSTSYLDKGEAFTPLEDGRNYFYAAASFNLFDAEGKLSSLCTGLNKAETCSRQRSVCIGRNRPYSHKLGEES